MLSRLSVVQPSQTTSHNDPLNNGTYFDKNAIIWTSFQKSMRLSKLQANRKHYRRQLQLIVDAHRIHVVRQVKHDDDLEDLKLITAQELFPCIQEIESLHSELRGLGYYLRVIRRDDFVSRIEDCRNLFLEIVSDYDVKTQEIIAAKGLTKPSEDIIAEERLALERLQEGITTNGLKNAPIDVTIESKPGVLRHIRDLQTRKSQADCPEPYPSAVFRLRDC
ncbi:hypothetical protein E4T56_gene19986 [Termitomyces sp. T112]|nr:hypothetical protein E4T56_gene19986 [Termitomyces sp. T112]